MTHFQRLAIANAITSLRWALKQSEPLTIHTAATLEATVKALENLETE